jgi:hypothetical protein
MAFLASISVVRLGSERVETVLCDFVYHPGHPTFLHVYEDHSILLECRIAQFWWKGYDNVPTLLGATLIPWT